MYNYKLTLCYDGGRYKGWQRQGNTANTIQARVEDALERAAGERAEIAASGRTDAGVHAKCQVCSFKTAKELDCEKTLAALREHLPEDIGALSLERAGERFHARLSCRGKTYVYRVWNSTAPNVFERRYMYRYSAPLDIVGTLIEVGAHSRAAEDMPAILASKDRERAGYTAPAQGLSLWQVRY